MIVTASKAGWDSGTMSATRIPTVAVSDNPTNGWRGPFRNFIPLLFLHFVVAKQALIRLRLSAGHGGDEELDCGLRLLGRIAHVPVAP
jgi:hypothetical protein